MSDNNSTNPLKQKSQAQWREELSPEVFAITRKAGTERPFSGNLLTESRTGNFTCACCKQTLFASEHKFDSGTGWPSFYDKANLECISEHSDYHLLMKRTEVRCANCDAHLGHVFNDGPQPTGLRYCINSLALDFSPEN